MADFISGCILGALVASVVVFIVMVLLLASKETGAPQTQSQQNDIESLKIFVGEPVGSDDIVIGWDAKCNGFLYGDKMRFKNLIANYEFVDAVNYVLRQAVETLKEVDSSKSIGVYIEK